jgi:hypothetical protein
MVSDEPPRYSFVTMFPSSTSDRKPTRNSIHAIA